MLLAWVSRGSCYLCQDGGLVVVVDASACSPYLWSQTEVQLDHAIDLMRHLPPQDTAENLSHLLDLVRRGSAQMLLRRVSYSHPHAAAAHPV